MIARANDADVEASWVRLACSGDREAFGRLYSANVGWVFSFVRRRVASPQVAEDLTAEVFLRALRAIDTYAPYPGSPFCAWLTTLAHNLVRDYYKSAAYRTTARLSAEYADALFEQRADADPFSDPERVALGRSAAELATRALHPSSGVLTDLQRRCVYARYLRGLSVAQTSDELGIGRGAVRAACFRAGIAMRSYITATEPVSRENRGR